MSKTYKNLLEQITTIDNLRLSYHKTVKGGNRYTNGHLYFKEHLETNLSILQQQIINNKYKIGSYNTFIVYEPKKRIISSLPFRDRVIQHSIYSVINPIFEKTFYSCSYACRKNKGTHKGVKDVQATIRRLSNNGKVYYLKMDFSKYFASIDVNILFNEIKKKISDYRLIKLLRQFVNKQQGIPIGNLLSQLFANIYGHIFDRFVKTKLKEKYYFRYMDDTVILSNSKIDLKLIKEKITKFIGIFMKLKFSKWHISSLAKPLNFLGYRISEKYKLLRKLSVINAIRKLKRYKRYNNKNRLNMFISSWKGHIHLADTNNLIVKLNIGEQIWKTQ